MSVVPYEITIDEVQGATIRLMLCLIHPDFLTFPVSKTFAFQLLGEPLLESQDQVRGTPFYYAIDWEDMLDEAYIRAQAAGFIASIDLIEMHNSPITEEELLSALESHDPARQVTGTYIITVTHPGWAWHLRPGITFQSTAFDLGEGDPWDDRSRVPGDMTWLRATDQAEGFKPGIKDEFSGVWEDYLAPTRGAFYYDPDPVLIGSAITQEALQRLLYQPVALRVKDDFHEFYAGVLIEVTETHFTVYQQSGRFRRGKTGLPLERLLYIGPARYRIPCIHP